jgi:hypothetical protein
MRAAAVKYGGVQQRLARKNEPRTDLAIQEPRREACQPELADDPDKYRSDVTKKLLELADGMPLAPMPAVSFRVLSETVRWPSERDRLLPPSPLF